MPLFDKALVNMQSIIHGYSLRIVLESTILLHTFHATRPRRRDALFFTHHVTHFLHLSLQPWEHSGKPFKGFARVTPVSVEEMMESEPFGLEVSVMVALAVF